MRKFLFLLAVGGLIGCGSGDSSQGNYYPLYVKIGGSGQLSAMATYSKACLYVSGVDFSTVGNCKEGTFSSGDRVTLSVEVPEGTNRRVMVYLFDTSGVPTHEGVAITDVYGPTEVEINLSSFQPVGPFSLADVIEFADTTYTSTSNVTGSILNLSYDGSLVLYTGSSGSAAGGNLSCYQSSGDLICSYNTSSYIIPAPMSGRVHLSSSVLIPTTISNGGSPVAGYVLITGSVPFADMISSSSTPAYLESLLSTSDFGNCYLSIAGEISSTGVYEIRYYSGSCSSTIDFSTLSPPCSVTNTTNNCTLAYGNLDLSAAPSLPRGSLYLSLIGVKEEAQYHIPLNISPYPGDIPDGTSFNTNALCFNSSSQSCFSPTSTPVNFVLPFHYDSTLIDSAWLVLEAVGSSSECDLTVYRPMWRMTDEDIGTIGDFREVSLSVEGSGMVGLYVSPATVGLPQYLPIFLAGCSSVNNPTFTLYTTSDLDSLGGYLIYWEEDRSTYPYSEVREYGVIDYLSSSPITIRKPIELTNFEVKPLSSEILINLERTVASTCELKLKLTYGASTYLYLISNIPEDVTFMRLKRFDTLGSSATIDSVSVACYNTGGWVKISRDISLY